MAARDLHAFIFSYEQMHYRQINFVTILVLLLLLNLQASGTRTNGDYFLQTFNNFLFSFKLCLSLFLFPFRSSILSVFFFFLDKQRHTLEMYCHSSLPLLLLTPMLIITLTKTIVFHLIEACLLLDISPFRRQFHVACGASGHSGWDGTRVQIMYNP